MLKHPLAVAVAVTVMLSRSSGIVFSLRPDSKMLYPRLQVIKKNMISRGFKMDLAWNSGASRKIVENL